MSLVIIVECDNHYGCCEQYNGFALGTSDENVEKTLTQFGWQTITDVEHYCPKHHVIEGD